VVVVLTTDTTPGYIEAAATGNAASADGNPGNDTLTEGTTVKVRPSWLTSPVPA
jgi:hypothetical protein